MEIEKKYTVKYLPENLTQYPCIHMEQGYLCRGPVVRVRKANEAFILTYKGKTEMREREYGAKINHEVELPLSEAAYEHLREKCDGQIICKDRYIIPLQQGRKAELDVFHGYLEGLVFVEVEFDDVSQLIDFQKPDWFDEDVTMDRRYANNYLSTVGSWKEACENSGKKS